MKEAILRAVKIAGLPAMLSGVTPGELAYALVQRGNPNMMNPESMEAAVVDAVNFLRDSVASLDALVARINDAKKASSE